MTQVRSILGIPSQFQARTQGVQEQEVLETEGYLVFLWEVGLKISAAGLRKARWDQGRVLSRGLQELEQAFEGQGSVR